MACNSSINKKSASVESSPIPKSPESSPSYNTTQEPIPSDNYFGATTPLSPLESVLTPRTNTTFSSVDLFSYGSHSYAERRSIRLANVKDLPTAPPVYQDPSGSGGKYPKLYSSSLLKTSTPLPTITSTISPPFGSPRISGQHVDSSVPNTSFFELLLKNSTSEDLSKNVYVQILRAVEILTSYGGDASVWGGTGVNPILAFGFGAYIPSVDTVSHCFSLNFDPLVPVIQAPNVNGVWYSPMDMVIYDYLRCMEYVEFHGPTILSQVIDEAAALSPHNEGFYFGFLLFLY
jgi:hypothetical protein